MGGSSNPAPAPAPHRRLLRPSPAALGRSEPFPFPSGCHAHTLRFGHPAGRSLPRVRRRAGGTHRDRPGSLATPSPINRIVPAPGRPLPSSEGLTASGTSPPSLPPSLRAPSAKISQLSPQPDRAAARRGSGEEVPPQRPSPGTNSSLTCCGTGRVQKQLPGAAPGGAGQGSPRGGDGPDPAPAPHPPLWGGAGGHAPAHEEIPVRPQCRLWQRWQNQKRYRHRPSYPQRRCAPQPPFCYTLLTSASPQGPGSPALRYPAHRRTPGPGGLEGEVVPSLPGPHAAGSPGDTRQR
ncbi:proline-rich protein 2 [Heliangelus exortis]|uniref:proline-rich protein 2 n=1 Tax=Heliangelus exortis TaxID=472823 RepID=UPI003A90490E